MTDSIAITDVIIAALTAAIAVFAFTGWRIADRVKWLTGAMERHSDQQRQITAKQAGVEMVWWDKNQAEDGTFPHTGEHKQVHRLKRIYIGIPEHRRMHSRWLPGPIERLAIVAGIAGLAVLALSKWTFPVTLDNLEWHGDVMGLGFLLVGIFLGALLKIGK